MLRRRTVIAHETALSASRAEVPQLVIRLPRRHHQQRRRDVEAMRFRGLEVD